MARAKIFDSNIRTPLIVSLSEVVNSVKDSELMDVDFSPVEQIEGKRNQNGVCCES